MFNFIFAFVFITFLVIDMIGCVICGIISILNDKK